MKLKIFMALITTAVFLQSFGQRGFNDYVPYNGTDLGVTYTPQQTTFKVWSPAAETIRLKLYPDGYKSRAKKEVTFIKGDKNVFTATLMGDNKNLYYTYQIKTKGKWLSEVPDVYANAVGVNGKRGMIVDLKSTNPANWQADKSANYGFNMKDAIIYELHVRDATIYTKAKHKGKFLGLTQTGLKNSKGQAVGLDHLKQLGVTHVQLLPSYDFFTVDETIKNNTQYNWGYDPLNYNVPEGSYSTNALDGNVRIKEFKQLIQTLHKNGINVIMDVVYNHTMFAEESYFNQLVPGYYYRQKADGTLSDASGCGNETASDRAMFRKYMLESVLHWVNEYHIDGFRFDLMAIHDIKTMNEISAALYKIKPNIVLLGEGWTSGSSPLPDEEKCLKRNAQKLNGIAVFSDDIRDAQKGSVFDAKDSGFISGKLLPKTIESIKFGLIGGGQHPQINYSNINYSTAPYTNTPQQLISYSECHDNNTLWDRMLNSNPNATNQKMRQMQLMSLSIILTGQGVPFIHAGQEMARTKFGVENSYKSPDSINAINWERKYDYKEIVAKTTELIALRKAHAGFRLGNAALVAKHVVFLDADPEIILMQIKDAPNEKWKNIFVVYNVSPNNFKYRVEETKKIKVQFESTPGAEIINNTLVAKSMQCVIFTVE